MIFGWWAKIWDGVDRGEIDQRRNEVECAKRIVEARATEQKKASEHVTEKRLKEKEATVVMGDLIVEVLSQAAKPWTDK